MDAFLFCVGVIGFFVALFSFILLWRYLNYRETIYLAEKGLVRPPREHNGRGRATLVWGILIAAIGVALTLGRGPLGVVGMGPSDYPLGLGPWMLFGFLPLFFGLALVLVYILTRDDAPTSTNHIDQPPVTTFHTDQPPAASFNENE